MALWINPARRIQRISSIISFSFSNCCFCISSACLRNSASRLELFCSCRYAHFLSYGLKLAGKGLAAACKEDPGLLLGLNTYEGKCTYAAVAEALKLEYTDPATLL